MVPYLVLGGVTDEGVVPVPPDGAEGRALHHTGEQDLPQPAHKSIWVLPLTFFLWTGAPDRAGNILTKVGLVVTTTLTEEPEPLPT